MTTEEVRNLKNGDEVFWNDPDNGLTSRHITIQAIELFNSDCILRIMGDDGSTLECFAHELE